MLGKDIQEEEEAWVMESVICLSPYMSPVLTVLGGSIRDATVYPFILSLRSFLHEHSVSVTLMN